jgi:uncharacterized protein YneF (UPF0154 family)
MSKAKIKIKPFDWTGIDPSNPKVQKILKQMIKDINAVRDRALADLNRLSKERQKIMEKIDRRTAEKKIKDILSGIK